MRNRMITIGLSITFLGTIASSAIPLTQATSGFLEQEKPDWIEAAPVPPELYPTLTEAIRAANLITHEKSKLHISSPTYEQAHRLLLQHLLMMERQLHFNDTTLAQFQSTSHPARSTVDPRIYLPNPTGGVPPTVETSLPTSIVATGNTPAYHMYIGDTPSRRSIIAESEERNRLRQIAK